MKTTSENPKNIFVEIEAIPPADTPADNGRQMPSGATQEYFKLLSDIEKHASDSKRVNTKWMYCEYDAKSVINGKSDALEGLRNGLSAIEDEDAKAFLAKLDAYTMPSTSVTGDIAKKNVSTVLLTPDLSAPNVKPATKTDNKMEAEHRNANKVTAVTEATEKHNTTMKVTSQAIIKVAVKSIPQKTQDIEQKHVPVAEIVSADPKCFWVAMCKLQPHLRAVHVFIIYDSEFAALKASMKLFGFDPRHPIIVVDDGKGGYLVVDGLSRLRAAKELGITEVYVILVEFSNDEALDYFIATSQLLRRECNDAVIMAAAAIIIPIEECRAKQRQGARTDLPSTSTRKKAEVPMSTSDTVGLILHRAGSTVDKIKKVLANPEFKAKVMKGGTSISAAYAEIMAAERAIRTPSVIQSASAKKAAAVTVSEQLVSKPLSRPAPDDQSTEQAVKPKTTSTTDLFDDSAGTAVLVRDDEYGDVFPIPGLLLAAMIKHIDKVGFPEIRKLLSGCNARTAEFMNNILDRRED